ncbi:MULTISPECIES: GNAT family N-acetyltransferase [Moraxella]|uniref:GNAT family acetyltransferase YhhY n=1 Tax=Moraxella catarrhalis TaxID=480 RepID=A0A7Z0UXY3_MORCA|nr:GNAT family N-acetyltransferase [Moraxella catarrhalis]OAV00338.1 GNAT family acetyltransferase YhhY [Moraxella catarrhalis]STY82594.1 putative acetyltransferase YhhY [Moraxella catarrhalis]
MTVIICRTEQKHAEGVQKLYTNQSVYSQTLHLPSQSVDNWKKWLGNIPEHTHSFVAVVCDNDTEHVVGNVSLRTETNPRRRHIGNFVIAVSESHQGQGVGSQLIQTILDLTDNWLNLKRVELTVYTDNKKPLPLIKNLGLSLKASIKNLHLDMANLSMLIRWRELRSNHANYYFTI